MGLQDALFKLRLPFEDETALEFVDATMEFISYHAIAASCDLARERGAYKSFGGSLWDQGIFPLDSIAELEKERGSAVNIDRKKRMDWHALKESVAAVGANGHESIIVFPNRIFRE